MIRVEGRYFGGFEFAFCAPASGEADLVRLAAMVRLRSRSFSRILIFSEKLSAASRSRVSRLLICFLHVLTLK